MKKVYLCGDKILGCLEKLNVENELVELHELNDEDLSAYAGYYDVVNTAYGDYTDVSPNL